MNIPKPLFRRLICFSVPVRRKLLNSILYSPAARRGSYSSIQDVWIVSKADKVSLDLKMGDRCWIADSFELEPTNLNLWDKMKEWPEFKSLKEFVESVDGDVVTQVVMEDSLLAQVLDEEPRNQTSENQT